jgi:hypothetical protein
MVARAASRGVLSLLGSILLLALAQRAPAQCVGDCAGDGEVTINDLILGVNIALGSQPVSACPAFANDDNEVTVAQLIKGVNNALNGCPPPAATATATATDTAIAATPTEPTATVTATELGATPTVTGVPTGTATATEPATATATLAATATATAPATDTATQAPTATATIPATATHTTAEATATHTTAATATATTAATATATPPNTATPPSTATATNTVAPTVTNTPSPSATPSETVVPPGDQIASRAAFISAGLGSIQGLVAAVVTAATNDGSALVYGSQGLPPPIDTNQCPISGDTTQSCTEMGSGLTKTINLLLGADNCVAPGPLGGTGEFDGSISIDSTQFILNSCSPLRFAGGAYGVTDLTIVLRDATTNIALTIAANLNGNVSVTGLDAQCLVGALSLSVNGTMSSLLPDGTGVQVDFLNTTVMMSSITYNGNCVPLKYTLKFNGDATFTPMQGALLEVSAPLISGVPIEQAFDVSFINFILTQDATTSPVSVEMDGTMSSSCFGGQLILDTTTPLAVAAGQLCPNAGAISVSGASNSMATVSYDNGVVTVTPAGGLPTDYPSCLAPELLMCVPA